MKKFDPKKLKQIRKKSKMSLEVLAAKLVASGVKVSYGTVRNWETGRTVPSANELNALVEVLQLMPDDFYTNVGGPLWRSGGIKVR